jgi:5-methylcytosine-specific restriction endonuclease McrA
MTSKTPPGRQNDARWQAAKAQAVRDSGGLCQLCGRGLVDAPRNTPNSTEVDHIVPLSQGGDPFDRGNLRAVHRWCHQRRDQGQPLATQTVWTPCPTCPNPCTHPPGVKVGSRCW